jgi:flagellar basal-body rod modification protein FlgD
MSIASTPAQALPYQASASSSFGHGRAPEPGRGSSRDAGSLSGLGKQEFLQLLIAQLRNQDPLRPMDDREFIAQLAQFNALEQMQLLNQSLANLARAQQFAQAAAYLGRQVEAVLGPDASGSAGAGQVVRGAVTEVRRNPDGEPLLVIDGKEVFLDEIVRVRSSAQGTAGATSGATGGSSEESQPAGQASPANSTGSAGQPG